MSDARGQELAAAVGRLSIGKRLPDAVYLHVSALDHVPQEFGDAAARAARIAGVTDASFNVVKFGVDGVRVTLLAYPGFFEQGFPTLERSWTVDLEPERCAERRYSAENPPILHRKESLLPSSHPDIERFRRLTEAAEAVGLFELANSIGTLLAWNTKLQRLGLRVVDHELVAAPASDQEEPAQVQRHKTALARYALSTPMQLLWRHGYLDGQYSVFDYGCGRGDDLSALKQRGVNANGWDPHYAPEGPKQLSDVVNLGFVLNVIEDLDEREEALRSAFALARKVLAVAVLIGGRSVYERHRLFRDGVLTQRGTFQKYFAQGEIREYLTGTLGHEPVALAPGVFFVFADPEEEQRFLERKQRSYGVLGELPTVQRERPLPRPPREPRTAKPRPPTKWETHAELLEAFYLQGLVLARVPEPDEFLRYAEVRDKLGIPATVFNRLLRERGTDALDRAREARRKDLLVYLALNIFERRKSFGQLPESTRRDIKAIWGSYATAQTDAQRLLFSVGKVDVVHAACREAASMGLGTLDGEHNLQLHTSLVPALPPVLRVYLGCAARLYGEADAADVVKFHIQSGKLSLMTYDDFEEKALPLLIERVKIDMRRQDISFFEYGPQEPQALFLKSRYMHSSMANYDAQHGFDESLQATGLFDLSGFGPPIGEVEAKLSDAGLVVKGFELKKRRRSAKERRP